MLDIIIIISLCVSMSKQFKENGKIGAGKYIAGIIGSIVAGEIIMMILMFTLADVSDELIVISFLPIILGYIGAAIIYNAGKKESLYGGKMDPMYQNQPYLNQFTNPQYLNQFTNPQYQNQQDSNPINQPYNQAPQQQTQCKAYVNGNCAPYGNNSGYQCDFDPNNWQNCQVVKSNIQSYGVW